MKIIPIFILILLLTSICFLTSNVHAASFSSAQEQADSILNNVLGINSDLYSKVTLKENTETNGLVHSEADYFLISNQSSVRVSASFINKSLNLLYLTEYSGDLKASQSSNNTVKMAKDFLNNYQTFTGDSFYGTLAQTLNEITGNGSITKSTGNMTLRVQNTAQATVDYSWTYTDANGINAQNKKVMLSYYNGQLNCFLDNWNLYSIVGSPKISREQAIEIALASVQDYSYQVSGEKGVLTVSVSGFKYAPKSLEAASLSYVNCPDASLARDGNSYNLYSSWWIPIGFDKFYPGDVTGIAVTVWADTGEVGSIELMYADSNFANTTNTIQQTNPTDDKINQNIITLGPLFIFASVMCAGFLLINKVRLERFSGFKKMIALLFCSLIVISAMASVVNANAVFPNSSARIYGSLDGTPGYGPPYYSGSPPQSQEEQYAAYWVQTQLNNDFATSGYIVNNNVGSLTTTANVLTNAYSDAANYDRCTVFHYGHMNGMGVAYVDNTGNDINYSAIDQQVTNDKYSFVLLWVCCQSEVYDPGYNFGHVDITHMCNAWMNNGVTSIDGYNSPDDSEQCFISFYGFSPWIGNDTQTFFEQWTLSAKNFIDYFYYFALVDGFNIHDSLNRASLRFFNATFESSIFRTGYDLYWPGSPAMTAMTQNQTRSLTLPGWYPCDYYSSFTRNSMQVFGDSSIYLFQPKLTLAANYGSPTFSFDGTSHGTGNVNVWRKSYSVGVSVPSGYTFNRFDYNGSSYYSNPSNIPLYYSGYLEAWFAPITTRYLDVISGVGGYTDPAAGSHPYNQGVPVYVTAYPDSGYAFDYWIYDGVPVYSAPNPVTITMNVDHSIQPVFYQLPPPPQPPTTPSVGGPSSGYVGQSYSFSASSTDPNGDNIRYIFNWGDGTSTTTGYSSSGSTAYASHAWSSAGQFSVTVTAEDSTGRFSGQSSPITMNILQTYSLTVTASDGGGYPLCPAVYVDGNYVGTASVTVSVTAGSHTVYVEPSYFYWSFSYFSDGLGNGDSRQITGNTNLHAWYY